jgi:alanine dehydrogenase
MSAERPKHLMIIGGGVFQLPAIKIAKSMGLKVVVTDYNPARWTG